MERIGLPDLPEGTYCTSDKHKVSCSCCYNCGIMDKTVQGAFLGTLQCEPCRAEAKALLISYGWKDPRRMWMFPD